MLVGAMASSCAGVLAILEAATREALADPAGFLVGRQGDAMVVNVSIMLLVSALCWVRCAWCVFWVKGRGWVKGRACCRRKHGRGGARRHAGAGRGHVNARAPLAHLSARVTM